MICEGTSDTPLIAHTQRLAVVSGFAEPETATWTLGRRLVDKVAHALQTLGTFDLIFVHRDADRSNMSSRYEEFDNAVRQSGYIGRWVGIVPVRMTETWLFLDEAPIRYAVRKPSGRNRLELPMPAEAERIPDPKRLLETAFLDSSETQGRRRDRIRRTIPVLRSRLLENLQVGGPLEQVPSWVRFRDDTVAALRELNH